MPVATLDEHPLKRAMRERKISFHHAWQGVKEILQDAAPSEAYL